LLGSIKQILYTTARGVGYFDQVMNSEWRRQRLPILCYHGISLADEHEMRPGLYLTAALFRDRLATLQKMRCNVLDLGDALERLSKGTLPERAVVLTFDDGFVDFLWKAAPLLEEFKMPATVYMTTYYSAYNRPIFNLIVPYMLWKARGRTLRHRLGFAAGLEVSGSNQNSVWTTLMEQSKSMSAEEKDQVAGEIATSLGLDYADLCARRLFTLMTPDEVRGLAEAGFDIQLHTHRHRVPKDAALLQKEVDDNRTALVPLAPQSNLAHFCYPSGEYHADSAQVLGSCGVVSATTCDPGVAEVGSNMHYLPRYLDAMNISPLIFEAWVSGAQAKLPHRAPTFGSHA
jgi:peptidoglycan/xylan/chitin deacetylase (PgdA/CDA1 family)